MNRNFLLAQLLRSEPEAGRHARKLTFAGGYIFGAAGAAIDEVLFPCSGLISVVAELADGTQVETGMLGHTNAVGGDALFGARFHVRTALAQMPGTAFGIATRDLIAIAGKRPLFLELMFKDQEMLLFQAQQTAACNARHSISERLATWLLRAADAAGSDELYVTQDRLAQILGVQRASVSIAAVPLQEEGLIGYRRGHISISSSRELRRKACECYGAICDRHALLFERQHKRPVAR